ncbi:MAG: hypothetical protein K8E66_05390, partial [Phycisphaerales bacterium]|nr:hypothetical protein [Phycisphaerales bacterium]
EDVFLFNLDADPGETTDLSDAFPETRDRLAREFSAWEAGLDKMHWTTGEQDLNRFDRFRYRAVSPFAQWTHADVWFREDTQTPVTLRPEDACSGAILEFPAADHGYNAANGAPRMTGLDFMLNQIECTGASSAQEPALAEISGLPLLFVPSLAGDPPRIELAARAPAFGFEIGNALRFLGPLQLAGDGDAPFTITGPLTEHLPGQSITKTGAHAVRLTDRAACSGPITIRAGRLELAGAGAALQSDATVAVEPGARLTVGDGARIDAPLTLSRGIIDGRGLRIIAGDYDQDSDADLRIEIGPFGPGYETDRMLILGDAALAGRLTLSLSDGFLPRLGAAYGFVSALSVQGGFSEVVQPPHPTGV